MKVKTIWDIKCSKTESILKNFNEIGMYCFQFQFPSLFLGAKKIEWDKKLTASKTHHIFDIFLGNCWHNIKSNVSNQVDEMAEWVRRWTANPMGSARVGSNLTHVERFLALLSFFYFDCKTKIMSGANVELMSYLLWTFQRCTEQNTVT